MDAERARTLLLSLPHVEETQQWGDNLVFWVADKALGGKMFCLLNLSAGEHGVVSFAAGPERFAELVERDGFKPAPYFARAFWVAAGHWNALRQSEWRDELRAAHALVYARLPRRTLEILAMPQRERDQLARESRERLASKAAAKAAAKLEKRSR